ncbi:AgmX/PglI C-terminal domain-containing protein [Aggregicoccus sp. 17bor-14]|uniref:AgmX/PglI C-terminal domain-containing protein n=1 Tax=Myxococcaceae TaxID=31 RepID=UPI00129CE573|nr:MULTISPECIES: AgmX/PglI C-terminal domain-containing protein [Myxococcaceae]MBF5043585.1 AgmX/PglI C-terminal domain-containing protein [Simulacricoccus sp. 17bor-14]MRI89344.1 AgmX/PglI C-terminal domain-containing protein [Aggregicoccus sp. 17bor-14]
MSGKSLLIWVALPFLLLCGVALWLTRGGTPTPVVSAAPAPLPARPEPSPVAPSTAAAAAPAATPTETALAAAAPPTQEDPLTPGALAEAQVDPGDAGPTGTVDRDALRAAVEAVRPLIRECFMDVTERYPGPQQVRLRFTLEGNGGAGRMRNPEVAETSIQDPFLLACFIDALEDAQFPAPRGGSVTVTYPFRFRVARGASDAGDAG